MARGVKEQVRLEKLGAKVAAAIHEVAKNHTRATAEAFREFPIRAQKAAQRRYDKVLGRVSGDLYRSMEGFMRMEGDTAVLGLRDKMEYARYQEFGTKHIPAKQFLSKPLRQVAWGLLSKVKKGVGFDG